MFEGKIKIMEEKMKLVEKDGMKFYCRAYPRYDDEFCVNEVVVEDVYKLKEKNLFKAIIVDIGANVGTFSIPASKYGKVYAYEPNKENYQILLMNIALNKANVEAFNYAVGKPGWDTIENASGHSRIGTAGGKGTQKTKVVGFDEVYDHIFKNILLEKQFIDLLKMDCEGGEYDVIKYASDDKLGRVRKLVGEFHSWIFNDVNRKSEHKEMVDKLERVFDMSYDGFKDSNVKGFTKLDGVNNYHEKGSFQ